MNPFGVRVHPVAAATIICMVTFAAVALTTKDLIERLAGR